jgi:hypothetical protein
MSEDKIEIGRRVWEALRMLVVACNMVSEEDINTMLQIASHKHTLDPMIDPTRYRNEADSIQQGETVLRAFKLFKQSVKGIGHF